MDIIKSLKFNLVLFAAKAIAGTMHLCKKEASALPGMIAMKFDKDFLAGTKKYCGKKIITVTGTNGKTTTSSLLADILRTGGHAVIHNRKGANMPQGIVTALAEGINPFKKADYFVLENDEAYVSRIYDELKADYLVVTNLFQDQTDRYGGMDLTAKKIREAVDKNPDLTVVLNADDPVLQTLYTGKMLTFGLDSIEFENEKPKQEAVGEIVYCPCGKQLNYTKRFYSHIGHYSCECGFCRRTPDIIVSAKLFNGYSELKIKYNGKEYNFTSHLPGIYNLYNATGAIGLALALGAETSDIQKALDNYKAVFGRANRFELRGKEVFVQLIKNPAGANEAVHAVCGDDNAKLLIMVNNEYADGRDVSWLWDTDFEALKDYKNTIIAAGNCAYDVAVRLKYANVDGAKVKIIPDVKEALETALNSLSATEKLNVLPTFSTLAAMQELIKKKMI